jgi:alkylation response protein AidB-like acyl-CoA dehydrogenase
MTNDLAVRHAAEELEHRFGDPWDDDNPAGFKAILASDERAEMHAAGEQLLDAYGLNAEFVPTEYGGRLTRIDRLIEIMRAVYRHDPCLGLGYGASSLIASVNVWAAGSPEQCRAVAGLLLRNRKVASAYHELQHGNDLARMEFEALPKGEGLVLNGRKEVITNVQRADAVVIFARTASGAGSRSHSQVFVDKAAVPEGRMSYLPRFPSTGMRGVQLGGIELRDCPLPAQAVLGNLGQGLETALKSFQITRIAIPAMFMGILDTGLRTTIRYAFGRRLYGRAVADLPQTRAVLTDTFVDLLLSDCFATVAARALHVLPRETNLYAPAVKYLVSKVAMDAMNRLSVILGAQFYLRQGGHSIFQKLLRDLQPSGFGHIARAACQMSLLPQLPLLARRSWMSGDAAPPETFRIDGELPVLPFNQLALSASGQDHLSGSLIDGLERMSSGSGPESSELRRLTELFVTELRGLKRECAELPPRELTVMASPRSYDLAARYIVVLAASACLNVWRHNQERPDPFLKDPAWLLAALHRLSAQLGKEQPPLPDSIHARLFTELLDRYESARGFDLTRRHLPGWHHSLHR